ncbi:MAG: glucuronate isomerase [Planctomycetaceae bacterium]|nr:glucuronate isomerase [Planctomycetaceae bacterium]
MSWLTEDFLLHNEVAKRWYGVAKTLPIIDYHSHLPPDVIAENRPFSNLYEVWLAGDHYKWRAMRAAGVPESHCTGAATPYEKFQAWARTVPQTLRNPLYHWTHLELQRYFNIRQPLNESTAAAIWEQANQRLQESDLRPQAILQKFNVKVLCTTDDPADDLPYHRQLVSNSALPFRMYPTFRPDVAFAVQQPDRWRAWVQRLSQTANIEVRNLTNLLAALRQRHDEFHRLGCRLSDHGLNQCFAVDGTEAEATQVVEKLLSPKSNLIDGILADRFGGFLMRQFAEWDFEKGWTKQLHLGARRNNNQRLRELVGADIGCDSIGDWPQVDRLCEFLNDLDHRGTLPKTIVYNLNPADNYAIATALGNFQDGSIAGKLQWGSGWWFLDQKEGMTWQLNALSNLGLLSRFVGMLTDSRSLLSFPRHEYFRRLLCQLIGHDVVQGELPDDDELLQPLITGICFENARDLLGLKLP